MDRASELAQRLRHQARLEADMAVTHLALEFGTRHQRRHRVDRDHVEGGRADQRFGYFKRLFARVWLRDEQVVDVHAEAPSIVGI
jgi:hypothetical protein